MRKIEWVRSKIKQAIVFIFVAYYLAAPVYAQEPSTRYDLHVEGGKLLDAVKSIREQTDAEFFYSFELANEGGVKPVDGQHTLEEALVIMFEGTGLTGSLVESGMIVITRNDSAKAQYREADKMASGNTKKALLASVSALMFGASGQALAQDEATGERASGARDVITVTATKRETALQDTPLSIAAVGAEEIGRRNLAEMTDYLRTVPGVNFYQLTGSFSTITIRGLSTNGYGENGVKSGTGVYLGDVPLTGVLYTPDLRMVDLERVEVLRGPQGTLFGSGTFAGAVRNIPHAPVLNAFEGGFKSTYSNTSKAGGDNYKFEGVVNIPVVEDKLALRAVAYRHDDSGYYKGIAGTVLAEGGDLTPSVSAADSVAFWGGADLYQNKSDINHATNTGGRVSLLWQATDDLTFNVMHVYQTLDSSGKPGATLLNAGIAGTDTTYAQVSAQLANSDVPADARKNDYEDYTLNLTNLVVEYDFGWASLLSSSAWSTMDIEGVSDYTVGINNGLPSHEVYAEENERFVQEVRLTSQWDSPFQYLLGVYYDEQKRDSDPTIPGFGLWVDSQTTAEIFFGAGTPRRLFNTTYYEESADQFAIFGELSYDLTGQLELSFGGRYFDYTYDRSSIAVAGDDMNLPTSVVTGQIDLGASEKGQVFKANLSYRPNADALLYAQFSQGFRLGDANSPNPDDLVPQLSTCDADNDGILDGTNSRYQAQNDSDRTNNYELGAKMSLLDRRLQVNAAAFRVDWTDIPVTVRATCMGLAAGNQFPSSFTVNGGKARSQGIELEANYQLTPNLQVSLGGAYVNAEIAKDNADAGLIKGDRLAGAPEISVNFGLQYEGEIAGYPWYARTDYAYVGDNYALVGEQGPEAGDYSQLGMSAGIAFGQFDLEVFGSNLTNDDGIIQYDTIYNDERVYRLRPRTIGVNMRYNF